MRLDFKILWFENQPKDIKAQLDDIKDYLRDVGFIPHIQVEEDGSNVEALGEQQELYDDFDLVVVDYDLGDPDRQGDWVAEHIRRHFGFTDIIFYSGKRPDDLRSLVCAKGIDGVYCFNRPALAEKLAVHIDEVVKRLSRLEAMRGLAMGVVGKCDDEFNAIIRHVYDASNEDWQTHIERKLDSWVESSLDSSGKKYSKCRDFKEKLQSRAVGSFILWKLATSALANKAECKSQLQTLASYDDDVLAPRNRLAHAVESRSDKGWAVESADRPPITRKDFGVLRAKLATHLDSIRQIGPLIGIEDDE